MESGSGPKTESAADSEKLPWWIRAYRELLSFVWGEPRTYKDGNVAQIERALCAIRGFSILGLIPVMVYGALAGYCGPHCVPSGGALAVFRGMSIALLAAIAAFSVGGMLGFLFGLPRWGDAPQVLPPPHGGERKGDTPGTKSEDKSKDKPDGAAAEKPAARLEATAASSTRANRVRPNTGLEKVMDWLTTLIVGLGLVHIRGAIAHARSVSGWVTSAIAGEDAMGTQTNFTGGAAILLPYMIAGFFLVYLWAQRYMGREMLLADIESNTIEEARQELKKENEQTKQEVKTESRLALAEVMNMAGKMLNPEQADGAGPSMIAISAEDFLTGTKESADALAGVDAETVADIRRRYAKDDDWFYDPMEGFGAPQSNGRCIEAEVARLAGSKRFFEISLSVRVDAGAPLASPVIFLLHHTFPDPIRRVTPVNGVAKLKLLSIGSFVAGALVVGEPATKLSLDLSKLRGVPQEFKDN